MVEFSLIVPIIPYVGEECKPIPQHIMQLIMIVVTVHSYLVPVTIRRLIESFASQKSLLTPESYSYAA